MVRCLRSTFFRWAWSGNPSPISLSFPRLFPLICLALAYAHLFLLHGGCLDLARPSSMNRSGTNDFTDSFSTHRKGKKRKISGEKIPRCDATGWIHEGLSALPSSFIYKQMKRWKNMVEEADYPVISLMERWKSIATKKQNKKRAKENQTRLKRFWPRAGPAGPGLADNSVVWASGPPRTWQPKEDWPFLPSFLPFSYILFRRKRKHSRHSPVPHREVIISRAINIQHARDWRICGEWK